MTINRQGRDIIAELLPRLVSGEISTYDYERDLDTEFTRHDIWKTFRKSAFSKIGAQCDLGLERAYFAGDLLCLPLEEIYYRESNRLAPEDLQCYSRIILFMMTDLEYEWAEPIIDDSEELQLSDPTLPERILMKEVLPVSERIRRLFGKKKSVLPANVSYLFFRSSRIWPFRTSCDLESTKKKFEFDLGAKMG